MGVALRIITYPPPFDKGGKGTEDAQEGSQSGERVESGQEGVSEAQAAAESENASEKPKEMSEREQKRGYSDKEANAARALVKDFDTMSREKRLSVIEMMRSAESCGASKTFMKHAAAMIGYWRKGLWIISDDKTSEKGFYQPFDDGTRLIVANPSKKSDKGKSAIDTAFVHELAHDIWDRATAKTRDALYRLATEGASVAEVEDIRKEYKDGYEARGLKLDEETLREEVFTNLIAKALGNEAFLERFDITPGRMTAFKRSIKAVTRMAKCFFGKDKYLYSRCEKMARSLIRVMGEQTAFEAVGTNVRFSIGETDDNRPVVVVNDDIVRYAANDKELVKLVKKSISKTKYVAINKQKIFFIDDTKNEVTYSEYTKKLRRKSPDVYQDKMRLFNHPSEVILATTNYINEGLSHPRKDDIIDFARGELLIDIQGRKYSAEVVIGFTNKGICELHDIVKIKPASFKYKTRHALRTISSSNEHFQTGANLVNNSIPQNPEKSTENAKKSFSLSENSSAKGGEFDGKDFIEQAIENGGSFEKAKDVASAHERKQLLKSGKIFAGMTDDERYRRLKKRTAKSVMVDYEKLEQFGEKSGIDIFDAMIKGKTKNKTALLKKLGEEFALFKGYSNDDVDLKFTFSRKNLSESVHHQKIGYDDLLKMMSCFDGVIENAVGLEVHNLNDIGYKTDKGLENMYVLVSSFTDGNYIIPVRLEIKEFSDKGNVLYVAVSLGKIKKSKVAVSLGKIKTDEVVAQEVARGVAQQYAHPSVTISIAQLLSKINPKDKNLLKYIPDNFLSQNRLSAKRKALAEQLAREKKKLENKAASAEDVANKNAQKEVREIADSVKKIVEDGEGRIQMNYMPLALVQPIS